MGKIEAFLTILMIWGCDVTEAGIQQLKQHEGLRLKAYLCPAGVWTVGYGHTGNVSPGMVITEELADTYLRRDLQVAEEDARKLFPNLDQYSPRRRDALINMSFNLGYPNFSKFKTFIRAVNAEQWMAAGTNLETTKWYGQVKRRAHDIVQAILQG